MITSYQPSSRPVLQSNETSSVSARSNGGEDFNSNKLLSYAGQAVNLPAKLINDNTSTNAEIRVNCHGNWCLKNHWAALTDVLGMLHKPVYVRYAVKLLS